MAAGILALLMNIGRYSFHGLTRSAGRDMAAMIGWRTCAWSSTLRISSGLRP